MRRFVLVAAVLAAIASGGAVAAPGRVVRVIAPRQVEAFVPGGRFTMGVDEGTGAPGFVWYSATLRSGSHNIATSAPGWL